MRGPGLIRELRLVDAQQVRERIILLEGELINAANHTNAKWKLHDIAHELRVSKDRLKLLEECISHLPFRH
jgi:hypothetical protein